MEEKINVNEADVETLAAISGIGPKLAAKIVDYRTAVHPFEELIELAAVPGISERMVREWADQLTLGQALIEETAVSEQPVEEILIDDYEEEGLMEETEDAPDETTGAPDEAAGVPDETTSVPDEVEDDLEEGVVSDESEPEEAPVVVTMLEAAEEERPESRRPPEQALVLPPARAAGPTIVETVPRRHSHLWQQFLGVMAGALFGSLLTLLLLYLFNGTLRFAADEQTRALQVQLDEETSTVRQAQSSLTDEMGDLSGRLAELDNDLAASDDAIEEVAADVTGLEAETADLSERLETIDLAAEKFDTFLTGMRDLLVTLQGLPAVPTTTLTITATTTISTTITPDATPATTTPTTTAVSPDGGSPTRTPRPTATPLVGN